MAEQEELLEEFLNTHTPIGAILPSAVLSIPFGFHPELPMLFSTKSYYRGRVGITPVHAPFDIAEQTYDKTTETITLSAGFGFTASLYKVKQESIHQDANLLGTLICYAGGIVIEDSPVVGLSLSAPEESILDLLIKKRFPDQKVISDYSEQLAKSLCQFYSCDYEIWVVRFEEWKEKEGVASANPFMVVYKDGSRAYSFQACFR